MLHMDISTLTFWQGIEVIFMITMWVVVLALYPLLLHYKEIVRAARKKGFCAVGTGAVLPVYQVPQPPHTVDACQAPTKLAEVACVAAEAQEAEAGKGRVKEEEERLQSGCEGGEGGRSMVVRCKDECVQTRVKEDDGKVGVGAGGVGKTFALSHGVHDGIPVFLRCEPSSSDNSAGIEGTESPDSMPQDVTRRAGDVKMPTIFKPPILPAVTLPAVTVKTQRGKKGGDGIKSTPTHAQRKRKRREEQNKLVAHLDSLLPAEARNKYFKGAGPRSAGIWGRSFFNVMVDTISHLRSSGVTTWRGAALEGANSEAVAPPPPSLAAPIVVPVPLSRLGGLCFEDVMMSSHSILALQVTVTQGDLTVNSLGAGARVWFAHAPFSPIEQSLRNVLHLDDAKAIDDLISKALKSLQGCEETERLRVCHYANVAYRAPASNGKTSSSSIKTIKVAELVGARVKLSWVKHATRAPTTASSRARCGGAAGGHQTTQTVSALVLIELPKEWVNEGGKWRDTSAEDEEQNVPTLDQLIGKPSDWMGSYKVDRHSGMNLAKILDFLGTSCSQLLSAADADLVARMLHTVTRGAVGGGATGGKGSSSCSPVHAKDVHFGGTAAENTRMMQAILPVQMVADCIELHAGICQTPQGLMYSLTYRLNLDNLPLPGIEYLAGASDYQCGQWHKLWCCNLSATTRTTLAHPTDHEFIAIATRYRGKPSDVPPGIMLLCRRPVPTSPLDGADVPVAAQTPSMHPSMHVPVTQRMHIRRSFDGRGASLCGQLAQQGTTQVCV